MGDRICSIEGCTKPVQARGWCGTHYQRWRNHGDPEAVKYERRGRACSIDGCGKPVWARGWCSHHYGQWRNHGDPTIWVQTNDPEQAFQRRTKHQGSCLVWTGCKAGYKYGSMRVNGQMVYAHRYAWERANGPVPDGMVVDHICHNQLCVKAEHLRLATPTENSSYRNGATSHSMSGVRNVHFDGSKWRVRIRSRGELYTFGRFDDLDEAAAVAERARRQIFGEFAGFGTKAHVA